MLNIYFDYLYAVIKFSRPRSYRMGNEPYTDFGGMFTDMPIAAILETGVRRLERNEKIGLYAIVLPKRANV